MLRSDHVTIALFRHRQGAGYTYAQCGGRSRTSLLPMTGPRSGCRNATAQRPASDSRYAKTSPRTLTLTGACPGSNATIAGNRRDSAWGPENEQIFAVAFGLPL